MGFESISFVPTQAFLLMFVNLQILEINTSSRYFVQKVIHSFDSWISGHG
jgi:hypothetical protein